jgi:hypothetical protein
MFAATLAGDPERYRVSDEEVNLLTRRAREFRAAFTKASGFGTRNGQSVMEKKAKRREAERLLRVHMNLIRADPSIGRGDKAVLNITERPEKLKRRECPKSPPVLRYLYSIDAIGGGPGRHVLEFAELHGSGGGKPLHAARLELFVELAPVGPPGDAACVPRDPCDVARGASGRPWYLRSFTASPIEVEFPVPMSGPMLVVYWGRWADGKGNVGPFSKTCVARVEGWNADAGRMLPGATGGMIQMQRVELKYVILQAPYVLPAGEGKGKREGAEGGIATRRLLPESDQRVDASRLLEAPPRELERSAPDAA